MSNIRGTDVGIFVGSEEGVLQNPDKVLFRLKYHNNDIYAKTGHIVCEADFHVLQVFPNNILYCWVNFFFFEEGISIDPFYFTIKVDEEVYKNKKSNSNDERLTPDRDKILFTLFGECCFERKDLIPDMDETYELIMYDPLTKKETHILVE